MKPNKVGQDFNSTGIKYPCAVDNVEARLIESRKIVRWFWTICVAVYAAIWCLFYFMLGGAS